MAFQDIFVGGGHPFAWAEVEERQFRLRGYVKAEVSRAGGFGAFAIEFVPCDEVTVRSLCVVAGHCTNFLFGGWGSDQTCENLSGDDGVCVAALAPSGCLIGFHLGGVSAAGLADRGHETVEDVVFDHVEGVRVTPIGGEDVEKLRIRLWHGGHPFWRLG